MSKFKVGDEVVCITKHLSKRFGIVKQGRYKVAIAEDTHFRVEGVNVDLSYKDFVPHSPTSVPLTTSSLDWALHSGSNWFSAKPSAQSKSNPKVESKIKADDYVNYNGEKYKVSSIVYKEGDLFGTTPSGYYALLSNGTEISVETLQLWEDYKHKNNWDEVCNELWDRYVLD